MFFGQHACRQRLDLVGVEDRHRRLQHDRSRVELRVHQMHGRTRHPDAVLQGLALRLEPRKRGQQRRMDIQDAVGKRVEQRPSDQVHEAGETDEGDATRQQQIGQRPIVGLTIGIAARAHVDRVDAGIASALQARSVRAARHDDRDRGVEAPRRNRVDDRLQVAPPARRDWRRHT